MNEDTNWKHVTLRVTESMKSEWQEYADNHPEAGNISHLVRMAVQHEINGRVQDSNEGDSTIAEEQLGEIVDGLQKLQKTVENVDSRLTAIEHDMEATQGMEVQDAVFEALPLPPEDEVNTGGGYHWAKTASDIADETARGEVAVREALDHLTDISAQVKAVRGGPKNDMYYWKRE